MSTSKGLYSSDSLSMVYSDGRSSSGFKFDLALYLKECEEEEKRLMDVNNLKLLEKKKEYLKKSHKVNQQGIETKKRIQLKKAIEEKKVLSVYSVQKPTSSEFMSEVDRESFAKGQKPKVEKPITVDDRKRLAFKNQLRKLNSKKSGLKKKVSHPKSPVILKKKTNLTEAGLKKKKTNVIARRRLNSETRRNMEKRHNQRILKLNQLNQITSKSTSEENELIETPKVCQSEAEPQGQNDFNIVFLSPRVRIRSVNKNEDGDKEKQSQTNGSISTDSSDSTSSKSGKFIMSKSELDFRIQQAVDQQFLKLKQEQQAQSELDRENQIKLQWAESKANFLMSPSVESFKSMIAIMPSMTRLVIKERKTYVPHFKLFAFITLAIICIFSWIYEFGEPIERIQNAVNDLFADHSKPKKMGFFY